MKVWMELFMLRMENSFSLKAFSEPFGKIVSARLS